MKLVQRLVSEVARVYGCNADEDIDIVFDFSEDGAACIWVEEWGDDRTYNIMLALGVLCSYKDDAGASDAGGMTVLDDLDQNALIGKHGFDVLIQRLAARQRLAAN